MQTLNEIDFTKADLRAREGSANPFLRELDFTAVYRKHLASEPPQRELACLRAMFPASFEPMQEQDVFAGRVSYPLVGFSPEPGGLGYYCREPEILQILQDSQLSAEERREVLEMLNFWRERTTASKVRAAYPPEVSRVLPSDDWTRESGMAFPLYRMAGTVLDYAKLLTHGLGGMRAQVQQRIADGNGSGHDFFSATLGALDLVAASARHYGNQARTLSESANSEHWKRELEVTAEVLLRISTEAPQSLREAIQLMWLYALLSGTWNYGRMDVYLGPFLARDLEDGRLDERAALELLQAFWLRMTDYDNQYNNRVIIGGVGRANEVEADAFALLALEATLLVHTNQPQLSLRFHLRQNPALYEKALEVLSEGRTFPLLYNDDVNVPSVMKAFQVSREEAEQYVPFGCGEYVLEHRSVGSPNGLLNMAKCLEVTLHGGRDVVSGRQIGPKQNIEDVATFDEFWAAYCGQVERRVAALALQERIEYDVTSQEAPFLLLSLLHDDCLERCKPIFGGGVRYLGGTLETYGNTNVADSLTAIQELVYTKKKYTLAQIAQACAASFAFHDRLHRDLLDAPKYGNDDSSADEMAVRVHEHVCRVTREQAQKAGLHSYLVVIINNWVNAMFGVTTGATPDGRLAGETLANANNPQPGMDRNGATAFLNSLVKLDAGLHAGAVQNMKFSKSLFKSHRPILKSLLDVYFQNGGAQAMLTVVDRGDLEAAMREPEKWGHLMVRVGGFSARFIDLPKESQLDLLRRTLY